MNRVWMRVGFGVSLLFLVGCSPVKESSSEGKSIPLKTSLEQSIIKAAQKEEPIAVSAGSFSGELMFRLMAAEIAAEQGDVALAASEYTRAAFATRDVKIIEQAMRYSSTITDIDMAEVTKLAAMWVELDSDSAHAHQAYSMIQLKNGNAAVAIEQLELLLKNFDEFDFSSVISLLSRQPNRAGALQVIEQLASVRLEDADAQFAHAHLAARFGSTEQALLASERVMQLRPNDFATINMHHRLLLMLNRPDEAIELLKNSLAGGLTESLALRRSLARIFLRSQKIEAAWQQYEIIFQQQPNDAASHYLYAITSLELKKIAIATTALQTLAKGGVHSDDARFQLGRLAVLAADIDTALSWYRSVHGGEYLLAARLQEAVMLSRRGEVEAALTVLDTLYSDEKNKQLNIILVTGDVLLRDKQYKQAIELYSEALETQMESIPLLYSRSIAYDRFANNVAAEQDLREILRIDENHIDALNALGYNLAVRNKRLDESLSLLLRAMEMKPNDAAITDSMGWLQFRLGEYEIARDYLRQALQIMYDPEIAAHLGEVLWVMGEQDRARHVWEKALQRDVDHPVLLETVERLDR